MTRRNLAFVFALLFLESLEGVVALHLPIRLDVAVLAVVYLALEREVLSGAALAMIAGYLSDVFSGMPRGLDAVTMVLVFFAVRLTVARIVGGNFLFVTGMSLFATLVAVLGQLLVDGLIGPGTLGLGEFRAAFPEIALPTILFAFPMYRLFRAIDRRFSAPEDEVAFRPMSRR